MKTKLRSWHIALLAEIFFLSVYISGFYNCFTDFECSRGIDNNSIYAALCTYFPAILISLIPALLLKIEKTRKIGAAISILAGSIITINILWSNYGVTFLGSYQEELQWLFQEIAQLLYFITILFSGLFFFLKENKQASLPQATITKN